MRTPSPVLSVAPLVLPTPDRAADLELRVSLPLPPTGAEAPGDGDRLPVILLSHGQGHSNNLSSLNGYAPSSPSGQRTGSP